MVRAFLWGLAVATVGFIWWAWTEIAAAQSDGGRMDLARILVGEADGSYADWAAILWTLQHRQERSGRDLAVIARYSAILRSNGDRARRMRSLGTVAPDFGERGEARQRQWVRALEFVDRWRAGAVKDPCPRAMHWGGRTDSKPQTRITVYCGPTMNEFFFCPDRSC